MPELPEVETVMRGLESVLTKAVIAKATKNRANLRIPFPKTIEADLKGRTITHLTRRAKYILIHLDDDHILVIHLGMSGRMTICHAVEQYIAQKHDHFILELKSGVKIIYNDPRRFGMIFMMKADEIESHMLFAHLGPEPLGNGFSGAILGEQLKGKKTSIKQALLDQRLVVGVGNIYACEALYKADILPTKRAELIQGKKADLLALSIQTVLKKAIKAGGSTLKDYKRTDGTLGYFQHELVIYDKEKQPCGGCDCDIKKTGGVKRIVQSGRSSFYCPRKQK